MDSSKFSRLCNIPFYNTKTGDVVILCGEDNQAIVFNLENNSMEVKNIVEFSPKLIIS